MVVLVKEVARWAGILDIKKNCDIRQSAKAQNLHQFFITSSEVRMTQLKAQMLFFLSAFYFYVAEVEVDY